MKLTRYNPHGLKFELDELGPTTKITLDGTTKSMILYATMQEINQAWYNWVNGAFVQYAFKFLNADEREFLMTGITPEEWKEIFPKEGE